MKKIILHLFFLISIATLIACNNNRESAETDKVLETVEYTPQTSLLPKEKLLIGQWKAGYTHLDLREDHSYVKSFPYLDPVKIETGAWQLLPDDFVEFMPAVTSETFQSMEDNSETFQFVLQEDTLMVNLGYTYAYRKLDEIGQPLPIAETNTDVPLPLFDEAQVITIQVHQVSSVSPFLIHAHSHYNLLKNERAFAGNAEFTVAEELEHVRSFSDATTVSIPLSDMQLFLHHISNASLVEASYRTDICTPVHYLTEITLIFNDKMIHFCSVIDVHSSSETELLPWYVQFNGKQYQSYSDEVELALAVIDPFLARDIETKLHEEAEKIYESEGYRVHQ